MLRFVRRLLFEERSPPHGNGNPPRSYSGEYSVKREVCIIQDTLPNDKVIKTYVDWEYAWNGYAEGWLMYLGPYLEHRELVHYFVMAE